MRDQEWKKTDDGVFMTQQALKYYQEFLPAPRSTALSRWSAPHSPTSTPTWSNCPRDSWTKDVLGVASGAFREMANAAVEQGQDDQPQMHQELGDNR